MSDIVYTGKAAYDFDEAYPVGGGNLGAMIYGGVIKDRIDLNENTLWSGWKHVSFNPKAKESLPAIRKAFFEGRYEEADRLANENLMRPSEYRDGDSSESPFGAYLPLGTVDIFFDQYWLKNARQYRRQLDLETGICQVSYTRGSQYKREYFVCREKSMICIHLTTEGDLCPGLEIRLSREKQADPVKSGADTLLLTGEVSGGLRFAAMLKVIAGDGEVTSYADRLEVRHSHDVLLLVTGATGFYGADPAETCMKYMESAAKMSYEELKALHIRDFTAMTHPVQLFMGTAPEEAGNLDKLPEWFQKDEYAAYVAALFFRYGRYLMVSSLRGSLPASLQGLWNSYYRPPWDGDYHLNCNTQMIYWPAEKTNFCQGVDPLFRWMKETLVPEGEKAAKNIYGARGWTVSWITNPYGFAELGKNLEWGLFPEAGAWLCRHVWEHYEYTLDRAFLKEFFPILRGACEFCLDMLAEDPETGKLLFGPTVPPEHGFFAKPGVHCFLAWGTAAGQEIVYDLFENTLKAAAVLSEDPDFRRTVKEAKDRLALPVVVNGMIHPWIKPFEPDMFRHFRHTYGHVPGDRISLETTPELIEPLKNTVADHVKFNCTGLGQGAGSWCGLWMIHHYAKLRDGVNAGACMNRLIRLTTTPNLFPLNSGFYQMDGILGSVSGITDMLMQSHCGVIRLLPALPPEWDKGTVTGLRARGAFILDLDWADGKLTKVRIESTLGGTCRLWYNGKERVFETKPGTVLLLDSNLEP